MSDINIRVGVRLRYIQNFMTYWFCFDSPLGVYRVYNDGWDNYINIGILCFSWITPPLYKDNIRREK